MRFAIISDVHNNIPNLKRVIAFCEQQGIDTIINCGDLANLDVVHALATFKGTSYNVLGNADEGIVEFEIVKDLYPNVIFWAKWGEKTWLGKTFGFTHYPEDAKQATMQLTDDDDSPYDYIFYGHTHKPWEEGLNKVRLVNPGNVAGTRYNATFATYDVARDDLQLYLIETLPTPH